MAALEARVVSEDERLRVFAQNARVIALPSFPASLPLFLSRTVSRLGIVIRGVQVRSGVRIKRLRHDDDN